MEKRAGYVKNIYDKKICYHHEKTFTSRCESLQLYCCDPFELHKKKKSKGLRKTESELVAILKIKPGQKLCRNCIKKATEVTENSVEETEIYDDFEVEYHFSNTSKLTLNEKLPYWELHSLRVLEKKTE